MIPKAVAIVVAINAFCAFAVFIFYHAKLILSLFGVSTGVVGIATGVGDANSVQANFVRFLNGELWPALRRRWGRCLLWVICSFGLLFLVVWLETSGNG